ncbi:hypothetical protein NIES3275_01530 [Microchaete diplosiphon NIES-3275]|nr:hypothetical protein NIES3275_01530 [Microchaete diplosiphon NIES-3275]
MVKKPERNYLLISNKRTQLDWGMGEGKRGNGEWEQLIINTEYQTPNTQFKNLRHVLVLRRDWHSVCGNKLRSERWLNQSMKVDFDSDR